MSTSLPNLPADWVAVARGDRLADLVLRDARLIDVFSGTIRRTDIAVADSRIAGLGDGYLGREEVELDGRYVCPGYIDAHVHVESSLVPPAEFARAVVPRGVTTVIANPHEIANVRGTAGIRFLLEDAERAHLDVFVTVPSCVPATSLSTSGARLGPDDLRQLLAEPLVVGLGEVMNFHGVVAGDPRILEEIELFRGYPVDGHCPGLHGKALNAYAAAGITSDHECTSAAEAAEKIRRGMKIFLREGSAARNLKALLQVITPSNERFLCFCTDDRQTRDLLGEGSIDHLVRLALAGGVDPIAAIRMATLNAAEHFRLHDRGAVVPGRQADMVVLRDLAAPLPETVYRKGVVVAREGEMIPSTSGRRTRSSSAEVRNTVLVNWSRLDLRIPVQGRRMRVIGALPGQLVTDALVMEPTVEAGCAVADTRRDLLKIAVIERHHGSGRTGLGFVTGIGLQRGAIASTVAHDHHNLIVIGADDGSMECAARAVARQGGGYAAVLGDDVLALLPLPVAGLMSDEPIERVRDGMDRLLEAAGRLGSPLHDPFTAMSFLGLEVIPSLKLTDLGLVDGNAMAVVPLFPSPGGTA